MWEPGRPIPVRLGLGLRPGYGEDGIYFDHRADCRDSALHKTCAGRWRGVISLGFDADGKRIRRKVSGQTKAEVKDKLKALHSASWSSIGQDI